MRAIDCIHRPIDRQIASDNSQRLQNISANVQNTNGTLTPKEALSGKVHDTCGKGFVTVTPGVRFADGDVGDQKRVMTPAQAKEIGSEYIVVGRPITAAADPVAAYERCVKEFCD